MTNQARSYGDCYEASLVSAEELVQMKECVEKDKAVPELVKQIYRTLDLAKPIFVVHGTAVPPDGIDKGRTILHAWLEVGDSVVETSNQQMLPFPVQDYYSLHGITPLHRYTVKEARTLADSYGYMPWHTKVGA